MINTLEDMVHTMLAQDNKKKPVSRSQISNAVDQIAVVLKGNVSNWPKEDLQYVTKRLEERFCIQMGEGVLFAEDYRPWVNAKKGEIDWYYSNRYERFLLNKKKFPPNVVVSMNSITDKVLDHIEDPMKDGSWKRKGLVVGHVQSGKTANYIQLINKSADAGYKVIIVLAGLLNSLRSQTQLRIDEGFIGKDSAISAISPESRFIGVGELDNRKTPVSLTNSNKDFNAALARQVMLELGSSNAPFIFVIKKNKRALESLILWLKNNNRDLQNFPMLLIDDEADHASINTQQDPEKATAINMKIRELLSLFAKSSYVGYTATPFANIFIDPEPAAEIDDLFPRDFILNLAPPDNYVGPDQVFGEDTWKNHVRLIKDYNDWLPLNHKLSHKVESLSQSLEDAVCTYVLSNAIRILRNHKDFHSSMLVNASRFTAVQNHLKAALELFVTRLKHSIANYSSSTVEMALSNTNMKRINNIFGQNFANCEFKWPLIQKTLKQAIDPVEVLAVNNRSQDILDYSRRNYPAGRHVIAVGGLNLSRGLTLEGLSVSYFLRNSVMYDTLMQMGRWFGYRDGYQDLCKIYLTSQSLDWYLHISGVLDELREEFVNMKLRNMTPKDFGLCVRTHPETLIITARNKMRSGKKVAVQVSLWGRLIETTNVYKDSGNVSANFEVCKRLIEQLGSPPKQSCEVRLKPGYFWPDVEDKKIMEFILSFRNHPKNLVTDSRPLTHFIEKMVANGINSWDVFLASTDKGLESSKLGLDGLVVKCKERTVTLDDSVESLAISGKRRRVGDYSDEAIGLEETSLKTLRVQSKDRKLSVLDYRSLRKKPLLIIHIIKPKEDASIQIAEEYLELPAYGIIFPEPGKRFDEELVEYMVNPIWWNEHYGYYIEEEEDFEDEQ